MKQIKFIMIVTLMCSLGLPVYAATTDDIMDSLGVLRGVISSKHIKNNSIKSVDIENGTITSKDIKNGTIKGKDIKDGSIQAEDLGENVLADVVLKPITSEKIVDGTIATADLSDNSVTSAKIKDGAIVNADVSATAAIAHSKLNLTNGIVSGDIVDGTIATLDIANDAVTDAKVVNALTIDGGTINNTPIGAGGASTGEFTDLAASGNIYLESAGSALEMNSSGFYLESDAGEIMMDSTGLFAGAAEVAILGGDVSIAGESTFIGSTPLFPFVSSETYVLAEDHIAVGLVGPVGIEMTTSGMDVQGGNWGVTGSGAATFSSLTNTGATTMNALTVNGLLDANGAVDLGDVGTEVVNIDSANWEIDGATGDAILGNIDVGNIDVNDTIGNSVGTEVVLGDGVDDTIIMDGNVEPDTTETMGTSGSRWSTIFADTLNYSTAITDANTNNTTVTFGNDAINDNVTIIANTAITDSQWSVTNTGNANFANINSTSIGAVTPSSGIFTALSANGNVILGDNVGPDTIQLGSGNNDTVVIAGANWGVTGAGAGTFASMATTGLNVSGSVSLPNNAISDADVSNALTASMFVGSGSTTNAVDLNTAEVAGNVTDGIVADNLTINGGTVDNSPIGNSNPAPGRFTMLSATSGIGGTSVGTGTGGPAQGIFTNLSAAAMDSTPVGNTTPAAGTFTNLTANSTISLPRGTSFPGGCVSGDLFVDIGGTTCTGAGGGGHSLCVCDSTGTWVTFIAL